MAVLNIVTYPDPILTKPSAKVETIDDSIQELIENMAETMYAAPGVGLAAVQVGESKRILVYDDSPEEERGNFKVLINPEIVSSEGDYLSEDEGCLSVPDFRANVKRFSSVVVKALDREGKEVTIEAEGFPAVVLQHEIDHLDGVLFIDRISALKRSFYKRQVKKRLKAS